MQIGRRLNLLVIPCTDTLYNVIVKKYKYVGIAEALDNAWIQEQIKTVSIRERGRDQSVFLKIEVTIVCLEYKKKKLTSY